MFVGFAVVFFIVEHVVYGPVGTDWEGFPGDIAESIKGTKMCIWL
jgi:hypothetical protein